MTLNDRMDFDHVIQVHDDGTITDRQDIYAPELYWDDDSHHLVSDKWELLDGWSRQDSYPGPIMHPSEYIGGGLERWILETPGVYVALVCECWPDDDDDDPEPAGWAIARLID